MFHIWRELFWYVVVDGFQMTAHVLLQLSPTMTSASSDIWAKSSRAQKSISFVRRLLWLHARLWWSALGLIPNEGGLLQISGARKFSSFSSSGKQGKR